MNDPTETRVLNYETSALYVQGEAPVKGAYSLRPRGKKKSCVERLPSAARARYKRTLPLTSTEIYSAPSHAYRAASHRTVGRTKRGDDAFGKVDFAANPLHSCHNPRSLALPPLSRLYTFTRFADAAILCLELQD